MTSAAAVRMYALLGDPVDHSRSPAIHNAAFAALGIAAQYTAIRCPAEDVAAIARSLARAGGGGNVTIPHKQHVLNALDEPSDYVRRTGACNTFWAEQGRVCGDNTDVAGVHAALAELAGSVAGARVLLLGAGGAARAACVALLDAGVARIDVLNRSRERTHELAAAIADDRVHVATAIAGADLLVHATSLGMHPGDPLPLADHHLHSFGALLDLVYGVDATPLVRAARAAGVPATDGSTMLVAQAAAAFERWFRVPAPLEVMRRALNASLAAHSP